MERDRTTKLPSRVYRLAVTVLVAALTFMATAYALDRQYSYDASGNLALRAPATNAAPQILRQPQPQVVVPGALASFSVVVADTRGLSYQWRFHGTNSLDSNKDTLLLAGVSVTNVGPYSVVLANASGSVTSAPALLMLDTDDDGLADSWEIANFGNTTSQRSLGDPDGDGISNLDEFRDGTSPTNNAAFRPRLALLPIGSGFGALAAAPTKFSYDPGEVVTLSATPFAASTFLDWSGSLVATNNPVPLGMNSNKTVRGRFVTAVNPPPGLIAWWRADTNANDSIGGHDGAFYSGTNVVSPSITTTGRVGSAFDFDGTLHVRVPDTDDLQPAKFTVEAWVYPTVLTNDYQAIVARGSVFDNGDVWYLGTFGGRPQFWSHGSSLLASVNAIPTNAWTHLAITFDGTTKNLYVNALLVATLTGFGPVSYGAAAPLTIGSDWDFNASNLRFHGRIDEVALYDRALTAHELFSIYEADISGRRLDLPYFTSHRDFPLSYIGLGYTQQVTAALGTAPIAFELDTGSLPPGVTLSSAGTLSGVPVGAGDYFFTLRATDALGAISRQNAMLTVVTSLPPPSGLVAWWRAENNAQNSAGTNHGTLVNGASFAAGRVGQTFALNGVNQSVQIPDAPELRPASFTLEAWVRQNSSAGLQVIFGKAVGTGNSDSFGLYVESGFVRALVGDASGLGPHLVGPRISTSQWHHVAFTFDGPTLRQTLYVNGSRVAFGMSGKSVGYDAHPVLLGRDDESGTPAFFFNGDIDEASIYNRELEAAEIAAIVRAGPAGKRPAVPNVDVPPQLPDAAVSQAYAFALNARRGTPPYSFIVAGGSLPTGLTLDSNGLLSGVPTIAGKFTFIVRVTDSASVFTEQAFALNVFTPAALPDGLVAWWRAESNALDSVGLNDGVLINGLTFTAGRVGQAFALNGMHQSVEIPDAPALRPASVTLEAWVYFANTVNLRAIIAKPYGSAQDNSYAIWLLGTGLHGTVADAAGQGPILGAAFSPEPTRWYHLAYTFSDEDDFQVLYIDGVAAAGSVVTKSIAYDSQPVLLGRDIEFGNPVYFLEGRIDEAAIYNRALDAGEIASIYNAGPIGKQPATAASPTLKIVLTSTNTVLLSWRSGAADFVLQQSIDLNSTNWIAPSESVSDDGTNRSILVNPSTSNRFYRLFKP